MSATTDANKSQSVSGFQGNNSCSKFEAVNEHLMLKTFWISFPEDSFFPIGFGVTAISVEEAYSYLEEYGYDFHKKAKRVEVRENIKWDEIPHKTMVHPNMGPIVVKGIWYPHLNSR